MSNANCTPTIMDSSNTKSILLGISQNCPSLQQQIESINLYFEKRYWHQLSIFLLDLFQNANRASPLEQQSIFSVFQLFVVPFVWEKINQIDFSNLIISASSLLVSNEEKVQFIESVLQQTFLSTSSSSPSPSYQQAILNCNCHIGHLLVQNGKTDVKQIKNLLSQCKQSVELIGDGIESSIRSQYLLFCCEYDKFTFNYNSFYNNCLLYLSSIDISKLELEKRQQFANDLFVSALLGSKIYNFGELIVHPIFSSPLNTEYSILVTILKSFNEGNLTVFDIHSEFISRHQILSQCITQLKSKLCIMSLLDLAFQTISTNSKIISFQTISQKTSLPISEVEIWLMKAMALGIIQGSIDQINEILLVSNVQPRVFCDSKQIEFVAGSVLSLKEKVASSLEIICHEAAEFIPSIKCL